MAIYEHPWYWFSNTIIASFSTLLLITLCILHSYNVIRDLYVKRLMSFTATTNDKQRKFQIVSILTIIVLILFSVVMLLTSMISWQFAYKYCLILTIFSTLSYTYSKLVMYWVFLLRLDMVYSNTKYQYSPRVLKIFAMFTFLYMILLTISHLLTYSVDPYIYHHINIPAIKCNSIYNEYVVMALGLFDIFMSICFIIAFVRPLSKLIAELTANTKDDQCTAIRKTNKQYIKLSYKTTILTVSACISTIILLIFIVVSPIGNIFVGIDAIINVISLMLMSSYYDHGKKTYFNILCFCVIIICKSSFIKIGKEIHEFSKTKSNTNNPVIPNINSMSSATGNNIDENNRNQTDIDIYTNHSDHENDGNHEKNETEQNAVSPPPNDIEDDHEIVYEETINSKLDDVDRNKQDQLNSSDLAKIEMNKR